MSSSSSAKSCRVEHNDLLGGRILVAAQSFQTGDVIFQEHPLDVGIAEMNGVPDAHVIEKVLEEFLALGDEEAVRFFEFHSDESNPLSRDNAIEFLEPPSQESGLAAKASARVAQVVAKAAKGPNATADSVDAKPEVPSAAAVGGDGKGDETSQATKEEKQILSNLTKLLSVWELNAYAVGGTEKSASYRGLFQDISLIPHGCAPNVKIDTKTIEESRGHTSPSKGIEERERRKKLYIGRVIAAQPIAAGDVLHSFYIEHTELLWFPVHIRRMYLQALRGFECGCARCLNEAKEVSCVSCDELEPFERYPLEVILGEIEASQDQLFKLGVHLSRMDDEFAEAKAWIERWVHLKLFQLGVEEPPEESGEQTEAMMSGFSFLENWTANFWERQSYAKGEHGCLHQLGYLHRQTFSVAWGLRAWLDDKADEILQAWMQSKADSGESSSKDLFEKAYNGLSSLLLHVCAATTDVTESFGQGDDESGGKWEVLVRSTLDVVSKRQGGLLKLGDESMIDLAAEVLVL